MHHWTYAEKVENVALTLSMQLATAGDTGLSVAGDYSPVAVLCWGHGAQAPPNLAQAPQINTGQLDTVVLLLVDGTCSIVIWLSRCSLPNDEGPASPPNIFS